MKKANHSDHSSHHSANKDSDTRTIYFGENDDANKDAKFASNFIKTSKFTWWNFLPLSLFNQFRRYANIYFLVQAILQSISYISPYNPASAVAPLIVVIGLSMLRELYEDILKKRSDIKLNSSPATKWHNKSWTTVPWKDLKVGDFVYVKEYEFLPADIVILKSPHETGACYIETSSLDGEKNLKERLAPLETNTQVDENNIQTNGKITCGKPISALDKYSGTLDVLENSIALDIKQLLLRGAILKNTEWVVGVIVYTGKDTKIMSNAEAAKFKQSKIEYITNKVILFVLCLQLGTCVVSAIACGIFYAVKMNDYDSIFLWDKNGSLEAFLLFFTVELLLSGMIPISLIVSLEFVKLLQGYFMQTDLDMYNKERNIPCKVFTTSINEELGQIGYIFSDKTGTLTCNKMEFRMCCIGNELYGDDKILRDSMVEIEKEERKNDIIQEPENEFKTVIQDELILPQRKPTFIDKEEGIQFSFNDRKLVDKIHGNINTSDVNLKLRNSAGTKVLYEIKKESDLIDEYFLLLSLCHNCIVENDKETGKFKHYQGPSPDEITLVDSARRLDYAFQGKTSKSSILKIKGETKTIDFLQSFEFNSDRKRMSVIVRHNGVIKFFVKGADVKILNLLRKDDANSQPYEKFICPKLTEFSKLGLRTLCMAMKVLEEDEYIQIENEIKKYNNDKDKNEKILKIAEDIEKDFTLIGCTAVEDRLQDEVPECIRDFLKANIKFWMLTGDKLETAENIGYSCKLIQADFKKFYLDEKDDPVACLDQIEEELKVCVELNKRKCILVEGTRLSLILQDEDLEKRYISIFTQCESVICCRVTPKQKADVVRLVQDHLGKICLAIGDGANDVNMIEAAHIGIGIYGNEGMRAVQASDFAIPDFKCLWKLVFTHGRWSYYRISEMILYFFYKNMLVSIPQFYFLFINFWSGQTIFDDYYVAVYNLFFTSFPLIVRAVFDQDIYYKKWFRVSNGKKKLYPLMTLKQNFPFLYYVGQQNLIFTKENILKWIYQGIVHGLLIFLVVYFTVSSNTIHVDGHNSDFWFFSITLFTAIVLIANLKISIYTRYWTILNGIAVVFLSVILYIVYVWIADQFSSLPLWKTTEAVFSSCLFYLSIILGLVVVAIYDMFAIIIDREFYRTVVDWYRIIIRGDLVEDNEAYLKAKNIFYTQNNMKEEAIKLKWPKKKKSEKKNIFFRIFEGKKVPVQKVNNPVGKNENRLASQQSKNFDNNMISESVHAIEANYQDTQHINIVGNIEKIPSSKQIHTQLNSNLFEL